jgi:hypothetical protein
MTSTQLTISWSLEVIPGFCSLDSLERCLNQIQEGLFPTRLFFKVPEGWKRRDNLRKRVWAGFLRPESGLTLIIDARPMLCCVCVCCAIDKA